MSERGPGTTGILLWMALFVIVGAPFVFFIWEFVNSALSGRFEPGEFGLALVGVVGALVILRFVARRATRWEDG